MYNPSAKYKRYGNIFLLFAPHYLKRVTWVLRADQLGLRIEESAVSARVVLLTVYKEQRCEQFKLQLN